MFKFVLIGAGLAVLTVLLHALGTSAWVKHLSLRHEGNGKPWRIMSGIQALSGILLVGWTTAFLFAVVQRSWKGMVDRAGT